MGIGLSYIPNCQSKNCQFRGEVKYILKDNDNNTSAKILQKTDDYIIEELSPYWIQYNTSEKQSIYWACDYFIKNIDIKYRRLFIYHPNYIIRGL